MTLFFFLLILRVLFKPFKQQNIDHERINKLVRQTARWATAADQDTNPYIANLHATYAMGYLMALRDSYSDTIINEEAKIDIRQLDTQINKIMDSALQKLATVCPEGNPKNRFLAAIAKEGLV